MRVRVLPGPAVLVDNARQRQGDLWQAPHFVDHHGQAGIFGFGGRGGELTKGVQCQGGQQAFVIEGQDASCLKHVPQEKGFPGLAEANEVDHPAGQECPGQLAGQMAGNQVRFQPLRRMRYLTSR